MPARRSSTSPMPSRCFGASTGSRGAVSASTLAHLLLVAAERAADRDAVDVGLGHRLGGLAPQVLVHAALHDPEDRLSRWALARVPVEAAAEPAVGALHRARRVLAIGVVGRALVEDEGDVGAELRLDLHRDLRRDEAARRRRGRSGSARPPRRSRRRDPWSPPGRPLPLTSSATPPCASEKTWKPPESVISARSPAHEPVQAAVRRRSGPGPARRTGGRCCRGSARSRARPPRETPAPHRPLRGQRDECRRAAPCRARCGGCPRGRRRRGPRSRKAKPLAGHDLTSIRRLARHRRGLRRSPSSSRAVGATSARMPRSRRASTVGGDDQRHRVRASARCSGEPSGSSMWSQLPWSAVTMQAPPERLDRLDHLAQARVDGLDRLRPPPGSRRCGRPCRGWRS